MNVLQNFIGCKLLFGDHMPKETYSLRILLIKFHKMLQAILPRYLTITGILQVGRMKVRLTMLQLLQEKHLVHFSLEMELYGKPRNQVQPFHDSNIFTDR